MMLHFSGLNFFPRIFRNSTRCYSLVIAEGSGASYHPSVLNTISAASSLGKPISVVVASPKAKEVAERLASIKGVDNVFYKDCPEKPTVESISTLIHESYKQDSQLEYIIAAGTSFGKSIIPRVAAHFAVAPLSEVTNILDKDTFLRPIYAGNAIQKVRMLDALKIFSLRPTSFAPVVSNGGSATVSELSSEFKKFDGSEWVSESLAQSELPELNQAKIVISGGRGLKNKEGFEILYDLAKKMKAAVGASRAAVDAGFCSNDLQIGQTGKVVAPELYMSFGISGAIQHVAGIKDSKIIVSVNTNEDSPIFEISDYYIVGDIFKVIPELKEKIKGSI